MLEKKLSYKHNFVHADIIENGHKIGGKSFGCLDTKEYGKIWFAKKWKILHEQYALAHKWADETIYIIKEWKILHEQYALAHKWADETLYNNNIENEKRG
tara:strand:+ start:198 stop:497 length:300 start_codon:yes stop_codon:yes gene_type:complete